MKDNKVVVWEVIVKDEEIFAKYVNPESDYSVLVTYNKNSRNSVYHVRPVVKYKGKKYIANVILKHRAFEHKPFDEVLDMMNDRINDAQITHMSTSNGCYIKWPNYSLDAYVYVNANYPDDIMIDMDDTVYGDTDETRIESICLHMDKISNEKCNAYFRKMFGETGYDKEVLIKEI